MSLLSLTCFQKRRDERRLDSEEPPTDSRCAETVLNRLCTPNKYGKHFPIRSVDAVSCALWSFVTFLQDPKKCIIETAALGGRTR